MLSLENDGKQLNLKLRGIAEKIGGMTNWPTFITTWLTEELQFTDNPLVIYSVYRLGAPINPKRPHPRDVIITLVDPRMCAMILDLARTRGSLTLHGKQILIFPDLTPEALLKRREMKPVTKLISLHNIKYKWITPVHICFLLSGKPCEITDPVAGQDFLWNGKGKLASRN